MEYEKCLVQLDEVLNYLTETDIEKIPNDIREGIKEEKDKEYVWKYDMNKKLNEQDLDRKTIAMLSYLNMEYLLNEEQKELMNKVHNLNEQHAEEEKAKKYNVNVFERNTNNITKKVEIDKDKALIEYKEEKWYKRVFKFLRNFFNKTR